MSGHSKWANIKYKKGTEDKKRAKIFSKFARLISVAAREKGGNPETNSALRAVIEKARTLNMPQEGIERAIKKGTGEIEGLKFEPLLLEGFGPGGVAILLEAVTDNKNRTLAEIRQLLERFGGKLASGGVLWMFQRKGVITLNLKSQIKKFKPEELELNLIDAGAEDIKFKNESLEVYTEPEQLERVKKILEGKEIKIEETSLDFVPKEEVEIKKQELKEKIKNLFEALDTREDIQEIYSNVKTL
ncbi:MAG: YebC/PmpR family DNA-binding transcriptional regulator [Parcubacteria group bacterium CG_4_9_14_0_2_um_filter_35_11]|nr:MAG: YebC/PmpR family DNA-binding transcriptional regulator [Parcubacteria group bacterium CG_4_9_14_0_2_um_filter_35_11]